MGFWKHRFSWLQQYEHSGYMVLADTFEVQNSAGKSNNSSHFRGGCLGESVPKTVMWVFLDMKRGSTTLVKCK